MGVFGDIIGNPMSLSIGNSICIKKNLLENIKIHLIGFRFDDCHSGKNSEKLVSLAIPVFNIPMVNHGFIIINFMVVLF